VYLAYLKIIVENLKYSNWEFKKNYYFVKICKTQVISIIYNIVILRFGAIYIYIYVKLLEHGKLRKLFPCDNEIFKTSSYNYVGCIYAFYLFKILLLNT
jgi:hypothetical protein